jgi:hypothetical protein
MGMSVDWQPSLADLVPPDQAASMTATKRITEELALIVPRGQSAAEFLLGLPDHARGHLLRLMANARALSRRRRLRRERRARINRRGWA